MATQIDAPPEVMNAVTDAIASASGLAGTRARALADGIVEILRSGTARQASMPLNARQAAIAAMFCAAQPKAVDVPQPEYEGEKADFDSIAAEFGYRMAGIRLERAVFTTKKERT